jgi:imidazoleglycerol-phosphate dehydratase
MSTVRRETKETTITLTVRPGTGTAQVATGHAFLDHMLVAFARYSGLDLVVQATGDLPHHLIEDVAICLGAAVAAELPATCARYADRVIPMDDALVQCAVDLGGRPYYRGRLPSALWTHFLRSFADAAKATIHVRVLRGFDRHHVIEAAVKAVALCVRDAFVDTGAVFSTKGAVALEVTP